jgi:hypothetical protein
VDSLTCCSDVVDWVGLDTVAVGSDLVLCSPGGVDWWWTRGLDWILKTKIQSTDVDHSGLH